MPSIAAPRPTPLPPHGAAQLAAAADRIKAHLQQAPGDLKGWVLLARTLAALGRFPEARDAYAHAIALAPAETGLHAELGEVLVLGAQGTVTPAAEAEFAKAPADPRSRYYRADAMLQAGDAAGARKQLQALLASAPADAPWRQTVVDRLAELSPSGPPAGAAPDAAATRTERAADGRRPVAVAATAPGDDPRHGRAPGPAARSNTPTTRPAGRGSPMPMTCWAYRTRRRRRAPAKPTAGATSPSAVPPATAATAAPQDAQGWIARAHQLAGLGRAADSLAALKEGNAQFPGNLALLEAYQQALAGSVEDDRPSPELVAVATQINALDSKEPDALWYLGLAAAETGDRFRAAGYWTRLLGALAPGDSRRELVQHQLGALH